MSRLPQPGGDEGGWGGILNDYLSQVHDTNGTLKVNTVGTGQIQDGAVTSAKLDSNALTIGNVADNSIPQSKVQNLTSDLAAKATDAATVHLAGTETVTGDKNFTGALSHNGNAVVGTTDSRLSDARTPLAHKTSHAVGGADALSPADINAVSLAGSNTASLANSALQFLRVNVPDDGTATGSWPDRMAFYFNGVRTGYHNEYGEVRARPGKSNTVPLRAMSFSSGSAGNILEVANSDASSVYLGVSQTEIVATVPVITPNLPRTITVGITEPVSPQDGDIWFDTSG